METSPLNRMIHAESTRVEPAAEPDKPKATKELGPHKRLMQIFANGTAYIDARLVKRGNVS